MSDFPDLLTPVTTTDPLTGFKQESATMLPLAEPLQGVRASTLILVLGMIVIDGLWGNHAR